MGGTQGRRRFVATTGTVAVISALVWAVSTFDTAGSAAPASTSGPFSLILLVIPVITLVGTVGLTWYLLSREAHDSEPDVDLYVECGSCGRSILSEWRLCPFCGSRVVKPVAGQTADRV
ncbi:MAG TPA: hypothetical protein VIL17_01755 [Coriobacteriia bacterium]